LDQSGTGNLKFTSAMTATGVGAKAITLQGATAGTGELAGNISDLGGNVISLNKYGSGDWTLSGNNSYSGLTTLNSGTLTLSGNNSGAAGGVTLTAGTLNINNNNALGSGALTLAGTGATINNTSGSAVVNAGNQAWAWNDGMTFGSSTNTAVNNLDLGTGVVTASSGRAITLAGTDTKLTMGAVNITSTATGRTLAANGAGNTLEMRGLTLSANTTAAVTVVLDGTASFDITGAIVNGQNFANGVQIKGTGTKTFSGANTYTGGTEILSGATLRYGANDVTANNSGEMYVNGGLLDIGTYNDTVSTLKVSQGGTLRGTTGALTASSYAFYGDNTVSAKLAGSGATLSKSTTSTVTLLTGDNTYGGLTTVSGGTLRLGSSTALGSTSGATTVGTGGFLDLNGQTGVAEALNYTGTGGLLNSATGTTATVTGAVDIGATMSVETTGNITLSGQLTGIASKNLTKSGAGTLRVTAANSTFAGTNTVSAGTLLVDTGANVSTSASIVNGGLLKVNGTAGAVTVNNGGSLEGTGTVGAVTLTTGSYLKPGNSPGLLRASSAVWAAGSTYNWEIDSNASSAVAGTNWDLFSVTGTGAIDMSALSLNSQMNLVLNSLSGFDLTSSTNREWVIAQAGSLLGTGGTVLTAGENVSDYFNINATAFNAGTPSLVNEWRVEVGATGKTLNLMAIPEPSTGSMLGLGLAGLVAARLLRRKNS